VSELVSVKPASGLGCGAAPHVAGAPGRAGNPAASCPNESNRSLLNNKVWNFYISWDLELCYVSVSGAARQRDPMAQGTLMLVEPGKCGRERRLKCLLVITMIGLGGMSLFAQNFTDHFTDRELINAPDGMLAGHNGLATQEPDEPRHAGKPGGHSLWVSWVAPDDGLAMFTVTNAVFDTLLAVYRLEDGGERNELKDLKRVASNDDSEAGRNSTVQFAARAGRRYEIAVDGYGGTSGDFRLEWALFGAGASLPIILGAAEDQALRLGETLVLTVALEEVSGLEVRWEFNGEEVDGGEELTLVIPDLQADQIGRYRLRLKVKDISFRSDPIEIQVNSEGLISVLARDKPGDALASGLISGSEGETGTLAAGGADTRSLRPMGPIAGVVRGYNGTQIFSTVYALRDPEEPAHCGLGTGASYWFVYRPPETGWLTLDTAGSDFDTVVAVYSYNPPLLGYESLEELGCDDNGAGNGAASRVELPVESGREYFVVIDGVDGERGIAHLNYQLEPEPDLAGEPRILSEPASPGAVLAGSTVTLQVAVAGTEPLRFQWYRDANSIRAATNAVLRLPDVQPADSGLYSAVVANEFGVRTTPPSELRVVTPPRIDCRLQGAELEFALASVPGLRYTLEVADDPRSTHWLPVGPSMTGSGNQLQFNNSPARPGPGFYRIRVD
jgi:hypothetical protein